MRGLSLVCLSLVFAACGGNNTATNDFSSPITACRSLATSVCTREDQCNPGTVDVSSCSQLLAASENCNEAGCPLGTTYTPSNAQQCSNDYLNQTCSDSNTGAVPASCQTNSICVTQ